MFAFESQSAGFFWCVLCHSLWSIPLIGLISRFRFESISIAQGDRRMRIVTVACIAMPFVIATVLSTLMSIPQVDLDAAFEIGSITSVVTKATGAEEIRNASAISSVDRASETPQMISFESIVRAAAVWAIPTWIVGMAVLSVRLFAGSVAIRARMSFESADPKLRSIMEDLAKSTGLRNSPALRISKMVSQPLVLGFCRPAVILPQRWADESDHDLLEAVLAHELAHIQRRDLVHLLIERIAGIVWFFHPAMHRLNRQAALWREMAADRLATEVTGDPLALARALESAATWAAGKPRFSPFDSFSITFASPRCRGRLGTRIEALLGPEGVSPVKISKKRRVSYFMMTFAMAFTATRLAAIGQDLQTIETKPSRSESETSVRKANSVKDKPGRNTIWIGRMNRVSSKSLREAGDPAPNPTRSFEVRLVSVSGNDIDGFLDKKFATFRTVDDHKAWIVDLEPVLNSASSSRRNLIHQAPKTTAAEGEPLNFTFTMPVTTMKYHPVHQDGKVRAVKPIPQTTDYDIYSRVTGMSGPQTTIVEIKGLGYSVISVGELT